jgi:hypothetical protein
MGWKGEKSCFDELTGVTAGKWDDASVTLVL